VVRPLQTVLVIECCLYTEHSDLSNLSRVEWAISHCVLDTHGTSTWLSGLTTGIWPHPDCAVYDTRLLWLAESGLRMYAGGKRQAAEATPANDLVGGLPCSACDGLIDKADHLHGWTIDTRLAAVQPREGLATNNVLVKAQYL